jgi:hypothetical protein
VINKTPAAATAAPTAPPCYCGLPIPAGRVAYCSDRCRWADDSHDYDDCIGDAA